jgi:hypothetical protein
MEKKQKGEQFRVIDPAKIPTEPIQPDMRRILILTIVFGLFLGGGLAYLSEIMDTSYKAPEEVEEELKIQVLASMPFLYTERERKYEIRINRLKAACVYLGFVFSSVGIILAVKGVDKTLEYFKGFF